MTIAPEFRTAILDWYDARARALPFRASRDPWAILVSEAMAQQTQISRVVEKWGPFMAAFPTVQALAAATPADVLRAWQGLGYNRRALNLWRAARTIVEEHGGRVPGELADLERLPGVGPYTARAVAAIAFGKRVGAVDTNVRRVIGRVAGGADGLAAPDLQSIADAIVPPDRPADWTHAVMDVGAAFCRPRRPDCEACPARAWCRYAAAPPDRAPRAEPRSVELPFEATSRWLRGRILEQLRSAANGAWTTIAEPLGTHGADAIGGALAALARDRLVELDPADPRMARLPLA
ncbi:MAG: A/G-specific adenine glycosylase [Chloroflexota bacterium]